MFIEFVINAGCLNPATNAIDTKSFALGDFVSNESKTAYAQLREAVNALAPQHTVVWIVIGFVSIRPDNSVATLLTMQGDLEWLQSVEYFRKVIGDGGSATPVSCGFIDYSKHLRVELENGVVQLRSA